MSYPTHSPPPRDGTYTGPQHYIEAESWLRVAADGEYSDEYRQMAARIATGHATLAVAAATAAKITELHGLRGEAETEWITAGIVPDYPERPR